MNSFYWYILGGLGFAAALVGAVLRTGSGPVAVATANWLLWGGLLGGAGAFVAGYLWSRYTTDGMVPSDPAIDWLFEAYEWFLEEFDGEAVGSPYLVTPTPYDIPLDAAGKDRVEAVFERVRQHAGMEDWPCRLKFHETYFSDDADRRTGVHHERPAPSGLYRLDYDGDRAIISCDPSLAPRPTELVAVLAHELSHYLLDSADGSPPGGADFLEPATDLASIFLGFGIFAANAAASMELHEDGTKQWKWSGYLSEPELAYGLAIFTALHDVETEKVAEYLDTNPGVYFEKARLDIERHRSEDLERLREWTAGPEDG